MTTTDTNSNDGFLSSIFQTALGAYTTNANAGAASDKAKNDAKTAAANAATAQSNTMKIIALVGGGIVVLVVVLLLVGRK